jgi:hypothetical protein
MAKAAKGSDSKQGLIISLVFSVLINIALGVFVYLGYAGQKEKEDAATKATQDKANSDADREWQRAQNLILKAYTGGTLTNNEESDLATLRAKLDGNQFKAPTGKEEFDKLVQKLDADYGWDPNTKKPKVTLLGRVADLTNQLKAEQARMATFDQTFKTAEAQLKQLSENAKNENQQWQKKVEELNDKFVKLHAEKTKEYQTALLQLEKLQQEVEDLNKKAADTKTDNDKELDKLRRESRDKDTKYEILQGKLKPMDWTAHDQPKGKIMSLDRSGTFAYLNVGSRDHVKAQLTFSVFGKDVGGKPVGERKAAVEVVNVLGPGLSMAKVTDVTDAASNPILNGDLLFNPAWNATLREHVAVAGLIDLTGDGSDSTEEFVRELQRQNIVVDMYLDLKTMAVKGKMTHQTGYLIRGEQPGFGSGISNQELLNDPQNQRKSDVIGKMSEIVAEANKLGVAVVPARRFLSLIGYKLPKSVAPPDYTLRAPTQRPAGENADADKKPEDKPEAKDEKKDEKKDKEEK